MFYHSLITYLDHYRKLAYSYEFNDFEDVYGGSVFYLYNEEIITNTVFLHDGISFEFERAKSTSNKDGFDIQVKYIEEYIDDNKISYVPSLEGDFSTIGDKDHLRFKYPHGELKTGRQTIKKDNEIRIIYIESILNKPDDVKKEYAEKIAEFDYLHDKSIVENYQNPNLTLSNKIIKFLDKLKDRFESTIWILRIVISLISLIVFIGLKSRIMAILGYGKGRLIDLGQLLKKEKQ